MAAIYSRRSRAPEANEKIRRILLSQAAAGVLLRHNCMRRDDDNTLESNNMGPTCLRLLAQHVFDLLDGLGLHAELVLVTDAAVGGDVTHDCFCHIMHQCHLHAARGIHATITGQQRHHPHPVHVVCMDRV
jgi:hypothetical protein